MLVFRSFYNLVKFSLQHNIEFNVKYYHEFSFPLVVNITYRRVNAVMLRLFILKEAKSTNFTF